MGHDTGMTPVFTFNPEDVTPDKVLHTVPPLQSDVPEHGVSVTPTTVPWFTPVYSVAALVGFPQQGLVDLSTHTSFICST